MYKRRLTRHVRRNHIHHPVFDYSRSGRAFARPSNLEKHRRNCTGGAPAAKRQCVVPEFVLRETRRSLGGVVKQFAVDMKAVSNVSML